MSISDNHTTMSGPEDFNPIPPVEKERKIDRTQEKMRQKELLDAARENSPELKEKLLKWLDETSIPEDSQQEFEGWEYADIAIMQAVMKYSCGFLEKEEVIEELEQIRQGLVGVEDFMHLRLSELLYAIEDDAFDPFDIETSYFVRNHM